MLIAKSQKSSAIVNNAFLSVISNKKCILESLDFLVPLLIGRLVVKTLFFLAED
jgi:hypothetical protein